MAYHGSGTSYAKILRFGYRFRFSAVGWDSKNQRLRHSKSRLRNFWVKSQFGLEICCQLSLAYKWWRALGEPGLEFREKIQSQYLLVMNVLLNCNHMVTIFKGRDFVQLMNGFGDFVAENLEEGLRMTFKSRVLTTLVTLLCLTGSLGVLVSALIDPGSARALTSIAPNPNELSIMVKALAFVMQVIIVCFHWYGHSFQTSSIMCYTADLVNAMKSLHAGCFANGHYVKYARQHRALEVLQANFSQLYPTYLLMIESWILYMSVLNLYLAVEFRAMRPFFFATGATFAFCLAVRELAEVHETSEEIMKAWKRSEHVQGNPWLRKFLRSCKPIRIPLGSLFYIDNGLVLTVVSIIIDQSANLILVN